MPYQPQPPMDANNTPGLAPRAQLPQNIEAEQSVLAACLLNGEVTEEAVMRLRPENFFRPAHRIIFEAIISLTNRHIPVDPIALADTLKSTGQLEAVGGRAYLAGASRQHLLAHQLGAPCRHCQAAVHFARARVRRHAD